MTATSSDTIAAQLAASAIWHRGHCNWVGAAATSRPVHAALGADLYAGTAGVGLFLAHAATTLRDPALKPVAVGALRHALAHAEDKEGGLYVGPLGVAVAAARAAHVLDDEELQSGAVRLLERWRRAPRGETFDVAEGAAGVITALLAVAVDAPWLLAAATQRGERLLTRADRTHDGWSWPGPKSRAPVNACGLFRGAAGIGWALLELSTATGDDRFRTAAERAFDYEAAWRDRTEDGWPDLRGVWRGAAPDAPIPASETWCHGAAGALVIRTRCAQLAGGRFEAEAADALTATRTAEPRDPWLCHGAAGIADALLYAGEEPSAPPIGDGPPGLFTGLAGIGLLQLRLLDRAILPVSIIHR